MSQNRNKPDEEKNIGNEIIDNIIENYIDMEQSIVNQLKLSNKLHPTTTGTCREDVWLELFNMIIPKKFVIEHSIFIIDSKRNISKEVDLAIIDNTYTPYIFQYGRLKYVPIEAVAAVAECKSTSLFFQKADETRGIKEGGMKAWCSSIEKLQTTRKSIARMANSIVVDGMTDEKETDKPDKKFTQTATRPIRIFCGYETDLTKEQERQIKEFFDFTLIARIQTKTDEKGNKNIKIKEPDKIEITTKKSNSLDDWYLQLDHFEIAQKKLHGKEVKNEEHIMKNKLLENYHLEDLEVKKDEKIISLLTFNFQLNQLLMLINNPILFPHLAYAEMFNGKGQEVFSDGK